MKLTSALRQCPAVAYTAELQAVLASPEDDAPRRTLADALAHDGDPWGRLIEDMLVTDALDDMERDRRSLASHESTVRAHPQLYAAASGSGGTPRRCRLRRGLVHHAKLSAEELLDDAEELFSVAPLDSLDLYPLGVAQARQVATLPAMRRVRHLELAGPETTDEALLTLSTSPSLANLERLRLHEVAVTERAIGSLASCPRLTHLTIGGAALDDAATDALATLSGLTHLAIEGAWITDERLARLVNGLSLRALSVGGTELDAGLTALEASGLPESLTTLRLTHAAARPEPVVSLVERCRELEELELRGVPVGGPLVDALGPQLTKLTLTGAALDSNAAGALASRSLPLGWLNLTGNTIGDDGVMALAAAFSGLTRLTLDRCGLGDEGARAIAHGMRGLVSLDLAGNDVTDDGAIALASSLSHLRRLSLLSSGVGDRGADALLSAAHLEGAWLGLPTRKLGNDVRRRLRAHNDDRDRIFAPST